MIFPFHRNTPELTQTPSSLEMKFTVKLYFLLLCTMAAAVAIDSAEGSDEGRVGLFTYRFFQRTYETLLARCRADELAGLEGRACP